MDALAKMSQAEAFRRKFAAHQREFSRDFIWTWTATTTTTSRNTAVLTTSPVARHASGSQGHQVLHRDLPSQRCLLYVQSTSLGKHSLSVQVPRARNRRGGCLVNEEQECAPGHSADMFASCPHQEDPPDWPDQVQGPLQALLVHPRPEGCRQGREAEAVPAAR